MGTNYYALIECCTKCRRPAEKLHIGKKSFGWHFSFQGHPEDEICPAIRAVKDWLAILSAPDAMIEDEYGTTVSLEEFKKIITKREGDWTIFTMPDSKRGPFCTTEGYWEDEGYSFTMREFS